MCRWEDPRLTGLIAAYYGVLVFYGRCVPGLLLLCLVALRMLREVGSARPAAGALGESEGEGAGDTPRQRRKMFPMLGRLREGMAKMKQAQGKVPVMLRQLDRVSSSLEKVVILCDNSVPANTAVLTRVLVAALAVAALVPWPWLELGLKLGLGFKAFVQTYLRRGRPRSRRRGGIVTRFWRALPDRPELAAAAAAAPPSPQRAAPYTVSAPPRGSDHLPASAAAAPASSPPRPPEPAQAPYAVSSPEAAPEAEGGGSGVSGSWKAAKLGAGGLQGSKFGRLQLKDDALQFVRADGAVEGFDVKLAELQSIVMVKGTLKSLGNTKLEVHYAEGSTTAVANFTLTKRREAYFAISFAAGLAVDRTS